MKPRIPTTIPIISAVPSALLPFPLPLPPPPDAVFDWVSLGSTGALEPFPVLDEDSIEVCDVDDAGGDGELDDEEVVDEPAFHAHISTRPKFSETTRGSRPRPRKATATVFWQRNP